MEEASNLAPSKYKWHIPLDDQPQLVDQALSGDQQAKERLTQCYDYLFTRFASSQYNPSDEEELKSALVFCFLKTILPKLPNVNPRAYPAFISACLTYSRMNYWRKNNPKRNGITFNFWDTIGIDDPDPVVAREVVWATLDSNPDIILRTKLANNSQIPIYASYMGVPAATLRKKVAHTMISAHAEKELFQKVFSSFGRFWCLTDSEIDNIMHHATDKQVKALGLYLNGYVGAELEKCLSSQNGSTLLYRLLDQLNNGFRQLPICQYFQRLSPEHKALAIKLAKPKELPVLQACLNGENLNGIIKTVDYIIDRSHAHNTLLRLKKRIEKTISDGKS